MKIRPLAHRPVALACLLLAATLSTGCSSLGGLFSGEKVDYRSQAGKTAPLDIPPDLTQLAREGRYQPQSGVVSASTLRAPGAAVPGSAAPTAPVVAPAAVGEVRLVREGNERWLVSPDSPDKLYPLLRNFWIERGFVIEMDSPEAGVLETAWAENRAKLPNDLLRQTLGKVFDSLYSTGERDRYRTRIERGANGGSEIHIVHRGLEEVYDSNLKDRTVWMPRPRDPGLEAEFYSRLMVRLGTSEEAARTAVATAPAAPAATGERRGAAPATARGPLPANANLNVADNFDRTWRQVGVALDRSGFTVEDRDRSAGLYFVRYIDPRAAGKEEPNFFQRLFSSEKESRPVRYRVLVKSSSPTATAVSVLNSQGEADNSEPARQIIGRLIDELQAR